MKKKAIALKNLPIRNPISITVLSILALDYWNAPGWLCGVIGVLIVTMFLGYIDYLVNYEKVDLFENNNNNNK